MNKIMNKDIIIYKVSEWNVVKSKMKCNRKRKTKWKKTKRKNEKSNSAKIKKE